MHSETTRVWLISGCSTGFGRCIAREVLGRGDRVVVTARNLDAIADFADGYAEQVLCLALDVTDPLAIKAVVQRTLEHWGAIDVLVNNAGYGYVAAIEEGEEQAVRDLFETNFFGALALTRAVLPGMRARGNGLVINNSSQAGLMSNPGTGYYSATKYALEGLMEALGKEVAPLGVRVCSVQPGAFRTDWSGRSMQRTSQVIEDYAEHVGSRMDMIAAMDGQQPGDPERAARVIVDLADHPDPPPQLLLGAGVLATYREKLVTVNLALDEWEMITRSVDFPAP